LDVGCTSNDVCIQIDWSSSLKAVIRAGGRGTRLSEETVSKPKPLVEVAGHPLIWHIMKNISNYGIDEFIVLSRYKSNLISEYFYNLKLHQDEIFFDLSNGWFKVENNLQKWKITVINTGVDTSTAGSIFKLKNRLDEPFLLTYGDAISAVNIENLLKFHKAENKTATLTAVRPPARYGALEFENNLVSKFVENLLVTIVGSNVPMEIRT
jgi:glucose-1-phosphate cytidylyltransferase